MHIHQPDCPSNHEINSLPLSLFRRLRRRKRADTLLMRTVCFYFSLSRADNHGAKINLAEHLELPSPSNFIILSSRLKPEDDSGREF
jgi:hypothetical protein